jgi:2-oxoglutarate ferredoxin oxidoreductase subunit gamma
MVQKGGLLVANATLVFEAEARFKGIECLMVPSRDLAVEVGDARLANMIMLGAAVEKAGVIRLSSVKKALQPALDPRYHHMIDTNSNALDPGARFARNGQ